MKTREINIWNFFLLFAVLAIFACVGFVYKIQKGVLITPRCIEVSAEVEKSTVADKAIWAIVFDKVGEDQTELNKISQSDKRKVQEFFIQKGIPIKDMEFSFFIREEKSSRKNDVKQPTYRAGYNLVIKSDDVGCILNMKNDLSELYQQGILVTSNRQIFQCSMNEQIKQELTLEAARKALKKAEEMARALNVRVKKINKVYDPDFQSASPHLVDGIYLNKAMVMSHDDEGSAPQRKIKVRIRMDVEIK